MKEEKTNRILEVKMVVPKGEFASPEEWLATLRTLHLIKRQYARTFGSVPDYLNKTMNLVEFKCPLQNIVNILYNSDLYK